VTDTLPGIEPPDATFTVGELNDAIRAALDASFPQQVWVRGEIQQLRRSKLGHAYFELVEKDGNRDRVRAAMSVALFRDARAAVNRVLRETPGVKIDDGVEVRIRGRVDFYGTAGRLQLVMTEMDPVFTVGKMAADRERILRALAAEGILRRNAQHALAPVPLRIGLVGSGGSAAYHDFMEELGASGHAFRVAHADVRVEGAGAWRRIAYALRRLGELELDAVVLIRGGGARSALAPFDAEAVARAITEVPVPVLTGIGHEVDRTIADEVAHTCCKTPTAAAALLVAHVDDYCERLARIAHRVSARARSACSLAGREVAELARRIERGVPVALARERVTLDGHRRRIAETARRATRDATTQVDAVEAHVRALDPRRVLERGYTITRDEQGAVVRAASAVQRGDRLVTETAAGTITTTVDHTEDDQ
jgi:exodeoxyribonuclease VII large subunit